MDIKSPAARFKEGAKRIADALRELETHDCLRRERVRTPSGRTITRTTSCNQPGHRREAATTDCPAPPPAAQLRRLRPRLPRPVTEPLCRACRTAAARP